MMHNNERTLNLSHIIGTEQFDSVKLVHNVPFAETLKDAFLLGSTYQDEWIAMIAGDQLLKNNAHDELVAWTAIADKGVFRISGMGYDWLHTIDRLMAPCVYRVGLLGTAARLIDRNSDRPEYDVAEKMKKLGYRYVIDPEMNVVVHDFGQYYKDIYRKGYEQARKNMSHFRERNIIAKLDRTNDHKVFLAGISDGKKGQRRDIEDILNEFGLKEKGEL